MYSVINFTQYVYKWDIMTASTWFQIVYWPFLFLSSLMLFNITPWCSWNLGITVLLILIPWDHVILNFLYKKS